MWLKILCSIGLSTFLCWNEAFAAQHYDFSKYYHAEIDTVLYPKSIEDVQAIVKKAKEQNKKIAISGTAMSQGGHTLPRRLSILLSEEAAKLAYNFFRDIEE